MNHEHAPQQVTVWHRTLIAGWMLATGIVAAIGLIVLTVVDAHHRSLTLWLLVLPAAFLVVGAIRVTVSPRGVTAGFAACAVSTAALPLERIESASARWTKPTEIGGWGYRWNPGLSAISLREGDAIWLTLTSGGRFVITIDDAGTAAELTNHLLARGHEGP